MIRGHALSLASRTYVRRRARTVVPTRDIPDAALQCVTVRVHAQVYFHVRDYGFRRAIATTRRCACDHRARRNQRPYEKDQDEPQRECHTRSWGAPAVPGRRPSIPAGQLLGHGQPCLARHAGEGGEGADELWICGGEPILYPVKEELLDD